MATDLPPPSGEPIDPGSSDASVPDSPNTRAVPPKPSTSGPRFGNSAGRGRPYSAQPTDAGGTGETDRLDEPMQSDTGRAGSESNFGSPTSKAPPPLGQPSPSPSTPSSAGPLVRVDRAPYAKGAPWKYGARLTGGTVALAVMITLGGSPGEAFGLLILGMLVAAVMTFQTGLKSNPNEFRPTGPPAETWPGIAMLYMDKLGDAVLTGVWNMTRSATEYRTS